MHKIFLTGGSGMVGKNIQNHQESKKWIIFAPSRKELDLTDYNSIQEYILKINPDIIIHAAAKVGGILSNVNNPIDFMIENIEISKNLILAAYKTKVKKLINFASSCMYPINDSSKLRESDILSGKLEPTNEGYAISKIFSTKLCEYISNSHQEFSYKTVIPCNLYGKFDDFSENNSHLIPAIINKIHRAKTLNNKNVIMWGNGKVRREFMYSEDLADAVFYSLTNFDKLPNLMNIGLGYDYTVDEYYKIVAEVIGFDINIQKDLSKPIGTKRKLVDVEKLQGFGWKSKTSLKKGIYLTYKYFLKNAHRKK